VLSLPHAAGQIISYIEMCPAWSVSFQKGMYFYLRPDLSVLLMSRRRNAPYRDRVEENGHVLIYEGHDAPRKDGAPDPKSSDQPRTTSSGRLTENGLFEHAASQANNGKRPPEIVAVYEKIHAGVWVFNGFFRLTDSWREQDGNRSVFKFRLEPADELDFEAARSETLVHSRMIPSAARQRPMCYLWSKRQSSLRPRFALFKGRHFANGQKHPVALRPVQSCQK
jgi:hypothetical protein